MATSDSGDERDLAQPSRKKRRAAQVAEAKFQGYGKTQGGGEEEEENPGIAESASLKFHRNGSRSATISDPHLGEGSRQRSLDDEEEDENEEASDAEDDDGFENEGITESDEEGGGEQFESEGDEDRLGKSSSTSKSPTRKKFRGSSSQYQDFAPPPFLQKILAKRQREMDSIRRQLPVDSRSREQKLADWYKMLSKLDKPVALLSLISPPQQD